MKTIILFCIFLSVSANAQWVQMSNGINSISVGSLLVLNNKIFAGSYTGVYSSDDNGANWIQTSLRNPMVTALVSNGNFIFASAHDSGVYKSSDNGNTWTRTSLNGTIFTLTSWGNSVFAGRHNSVHITTDNGVTWQTSFVSQNPDIGSLSSNIYAIFIGEHGVYKSINNGFSWNQTLNTGALIVNSLTTNGNTIFAGSLGVNRSTDNGITWSQAGMNSSYVRALLINGNNIFAGTSGDGVYVSTDNGLNWVQRSEGLQGVSIVKSFCVLNNFVFAGTSNSKIYRRHLTELVGIHPISTEIPNQFSLSQNYPNPFNPSTKIQFALPKSSFAKLVVYDMLGKEVETLVNEQLNAGTYEADFDGSNFASGIYYYTLSASPEGMDTQTPLSTTYTETKKMVLMK